MCVGLSWGRSTPRIRGIGPISSRNDESARNQEYSTLALFVARVGADHKQSALAPDQFAILANTLDASANFHGAPTFRAKGRDFWEINILVILPAPTRGNLEIAPRRPSLRLPGRGR